MSLTFLIGGVAHGEVIQTGADAEAVVVHSAHLGITSDTYRREVRVDRQGREYHVGILLSREHPASWDQISRTQGPPPL
jgi:hypothetical protein